jgi:hypothetical protein
MHRAAVVFMAPAIPQPDRRWDDGRRQMSAHGLARRSSIRRWICIVTE